MPKHPDFIKIHRRFIKQYDEKKGEDLYFAFIKKKGYDDTKPFPRSKEKKEKLCIVKGLEIKETEKEYHIEGLIATTHIDSLDKEDGVDIPDMIPKDTLEDMALQMNSNFRSRVMGVHHSEGKPINAEYYGVADVENNPVTVIPLIDGEFGLYVDTKLLKNDPKTPKIIESFQSDDPESLNSFSITYDTNEFMTTDFSWIKDKLVRVLLPGTNLHGYTAASHPVNPNAVATAYGFKEFKELVNGKNYSAQKEVKQMVKENKEEDIPEDKSEDKPEDKSEDKPEDKSEDKPEDKPAEDAEKSSEQKEFQKWKDSQKDLEEKELLEKSAEKIAGKVLEKMEIKEKVLKDNNPSGKNTEISFEIKELKEVIEKPASFELKEQFRRAAAACDHLKIDWQDASTSACESREYKSFGVKGTSLEYKGLGITTNQNTDTDYLQSSAELQDMYDPVIYNALNQKIVTWNLLAKDDYSKKGNNQVQFTLKIAANASASFYSGNAVVTDNVTRLKYQTKFKKIQVGVSVDGDMIAAARGGPVSDVFAQEVMDSTMDMLSVLNLALFAEVGLETASAVIGFEYITDSANNTSLYNLTRSAANKLSPDSAGDTYIDQNSTVISMTNLRAAIRQAVTEGADKRKLIFITSLVQGDMLRGKFDDTKRALSSKDTDFGFSTDLFVDGVPVFEDKDCNSDDWFLVDQETHRVGIWIPPTIEKLGKNSDSEAAFIKSYLATYNRGPRRMVQIYDCATS